MDQLMRLSADIDNCSNISVTNIVTGAITGKKMNVYEYGETSLAERTKNRRNQSFQDRDPQSSYRGTIKKK